MLLLREAKIRAFEIVYLDNQLSRKLMIHADMLPVLQNKYEYKQNRVEIDASHGRSHALLIVKHTFPACHTTEEDTIRLSRFLGWGRGL